MGPGQFPRYTDARKGRLWATTAPEDSNTYTTTEPTELGDKNAFRNQPRATGSPAEIQQEIPQENSEKHPDNMFKVITHTRNKSHNAEFDGAGYQEVGLG